MTDTTEFFKSLYSDKIAYKSNQLGANITVFFFGGYSSEMTGTKASNLSSWTQSKKLNFVRFDYSGHGQSSGSFNEGTITKWSDEANEVFNKFKTKKNILIGSSMGGWISLLVTLKNLDAVDSFIGIASATDWTVSEWNNLSLKEQENFKEKGSILYPDADYGAYEVSYNFINKSFNNLLLDKKINITCPVRLLHGRLDKVVPFSNSEKIINQIISQDKKLIIIEDGEHSLSRQSDLNILFNQIQEFI